MADIIDNNGTMINGTNTLSGSAVSFSTPRITNITSLKVYFSPKQAGAGDPSPENVREITGWDNVVVHRIGKNLYDAVSYPMLEKKWIHGGFGIIGGDSNFDCTDYIPFEGFDGYIITLNKRPGGSNPGIAFYSSNTESAYISGVRNNNGTPNTSMSATVPAGTKYMRFTVPHGAKDI